MDDVVRYAAWAGLAVAVGSLVVAYLVHADAVRRDAAVERRAIEREIGHRVEDAREQAISRVVERYHMLRHQTGAGANLGTIRDAGIAELRTNADMRTAIDRMAASGSDPMQQFRKLLDSLDLVQVFDHSLANNVAVDRSIEATFRAKHDNAG